MRRATCSPHCDLERPDVMKALRFTGGSQDLLAVIVKASMKISMFKLILVRI